MTHEFISRASNVNIDTSLSTKNRFRWAWLEEKDTHDERYGDYLRKIKQDGYAYCTYCRNELKYASKGKKT